VNTAVIVAVPLTVPALNVAVACPRASVVTTEGASVPSVDERLTIREVSSFTCTVTVSLPPTVKKAVSVETLMVGRPDAAATRARRAKPTRSIFLISLSMADPCVANKENSYYINIPIF
jgi:hypothetical protein